MLGFFRRVNPLTRSNTMSIELPKGYALGNVEYTVIAGKYESDGERNI